jgi:hypothetical protein
MIRTDRIVIGFVILLCRRARPSADRMIAQLA